VKLTVSRAWKPESGRSYGEVEITMAPDFERDDPTMWGLVNAKDLAKTTRFRRLTVIGNRNWQPRWDLIPTPGTEEWRTHLGGNGWRTALSGVCATNARLYFDRLEVIGLPGSGIHYIGIPPVIESGRMERVGWPVFSEHGSPLPQPGGSIRNLLAIDEWGSKLWPGQYPKWGTVSLRQQDTQVVCPGELVVVGDGWELVNFTHVGDGGGFKVGGTRWRVTGAQVGQGFLAGGGMGGLGGAVDCRVEDSVFSGSNNAMRAHACLFISDPFVEPVRTQHGPRGTDQPRRAGGLRGLRVHRLAGPGRCVRAEHARPAPVGGLPILGELSCWHSSPPRSPLAPPRAVSRSRAPTTGRSSTKTI